MTENNEEKNKDENLVSFVINSEEISSPNTIGIYGDIDEELSLSTVHSLLSYKSMCQQSITLEEDNKEQDSPEPLQIIISTHGGSAHEMFAIYDVMRLLKKECELETIGIGKVMSAGVVLLAAGTKGKRKIGENCRVMVHPVASASVGDLSDIENETKEIKILQKLYTKALVENSELTESQVKKMLKKKINVYMSAEEALKHGIVDEII